MQGIIRDNVAKGSTVMTDEDRSFVGPDGDYSISRQPFGGRVCSPLHSHTNTIEWVWALLKRQIVGVHHWVSPKHLDRYVDRNELALNRRDLKVTPRMNDLFSCVEGRLPYRDLIA